MPEEHWIVGLYSVLKESIVFIWSSTNPPAPWSIVIGLHLATRQRFVSGVADWRRQRLDGTPGESNDAQRWGYGVRGCASHWMDHMAKKSSLSDIQMLAKEKQPLLSCMCTCFVDISGIVWIICLPHPSTTPATAFVGRLAYCPRGECRHSKNGRLAFFSGDLQIRSVA